MKSGKSELNLFSNQVELFVFEHSHLLSKFSKIEIQKIKPIKIYTEEGL